MNQTQLTVLAVLCCCCGCGQDWQARTHPAAGMLSVNGEPPAGAVVTLVPVGEKIDQRNSRPWAVVDDLGMFQLQTYEANDGAPVGEYDVTIKWPWDVTVLELAMTDRLRGAFSQPDQSQWRVTIEEGENQLPLIDITAEVDHDPPETNGRSRQPGPAGPRMGR